MHSVFHTAMHFQLHKEHCLSAILMSKSIFQ